MINFTIIGCVHMVSYHRSPIQVHWMVHVINISLWIKIALLTKLLYRYCTDIPVNGSSIWEVYS